MIDSLASFHCLSVVRTTCLREVVKRGTWLGLVGIFPLLLSAILLPSQILHGWGLGMFVFFLTCLMCGLLPYKRLVKKQLHPDVLFIEGPFLIYALNGRNGRIKRCIPVDQVLSSQYIAYSTNYYGIEVFLKNEKLHVNESEDKNKNKKIRVFFPYFTQGTDHLLQEALHEKIT